jgi:transcriptional pleiotropic repressor
MKLIDKLRALNRLLQRTAGHAVSFIEMAEVLVSTIHSNSFVISRRGKLLGYGLLDQRETGAPHSTIIADKRVPADYNSLLFSVLETVTNASGNSTQLHIVEQINKLFGFEQLAIVPIIGGVERIGTLILSRNGPSFSEDDIILGEYGATIVGMEILRGYVDENEIEARSKAAVQVAMNSLSFSELEAVEHILEELKEREGLLVASKIADRAGITRSVIVNALRKLESAGVVETRSLGMKGTYIKILNDRLMNEFLKSDVKSRV